MDEKKVLIIEDDLSTRDAITRKFLQAGAVVYGASDGEEGFRQLRGLHPELIIIDVKFPGREDWNTIRLLQKSAGVPVIVLSTIKPGKDEMKSFDNGSIRFLNKPFSLRELLVLAEAAVQQSPNPNGRVEETIYDDGYLRVNFGAREILLHGKPVKLTKTEYRLLCCLMDRENQFVAYDQILREVWGLGYDDSVDYVHVYVSMLRKKLEEKRERPRYLMSQRGVGYCFKCN